MRIENRLCIRRHAAFKAGLLIAMILLSMTLLITSVQGSWSQATVPVTNSLQGVSMVSATDGWAVGDGGAILHYTGGSWNMATSPTTNTLNDLDMVTATEGWAVGSSGTILRCTGGSWSSAASPTTYTLNWIDMVSATEGWAVGSSGIILRCSGGSWNAVASPTTYTLYSLDMVTATEGWAVGANGVILRLSGTTWSNYTSSPTTSSLYSVDMVSATDGWAVGLSGTVLRLTGGTWNKVTGIPTTNTLYSVNMVSATDGWAVGSSGVILHWNGSTWSLVHVSTTNTLYDVAMVSATNGWIVGYSATMLKWVADAPVASFTITPSSPTVNSAVSFDASGSNDTDGTITSYSWDFGDGNTGSGVTTSHTYTLAKTYTVNLTVTDNSGLKGTLSKSITVNSGGTGGFTASASAPNTNIKTGQSVTITVTASGGAGSYEYQWYRNEKIMIGKTSDNLPVTENTAGTYKFYCIVTDADNENATSNEITLTVTTQQIAINGNAQTANSTTVTLTLSASGIMSGITQMCFSNNNEDWTSWETYSTTKEWTLTSGNGTKTVYVKFMDDAGTESDVYQDSITLAMPESAGEFPWALLIAVVVVVIVVVIVVILLLRRKRKPPVPSQLRITAEPANLVADGHTKSVITMQLLDKKGKPIAAMADTQVKISATKGQLEKPVVTIPKGKDTEKTTIVSSTETGQVPISADSEGLKSITITLNFMEKNRYCMHCGTQMTVRAKACPNCGKLPPAGVDTKVCPNCGEVIPQAARFCSECGAGQAV